MRGLPRFTATKPHSSSRAEVALSPAFTAGMKWRSSVPEGPLPPRINSSQPSKASAAADSSALKTKKRLSWSACSSIVRDSLTGSLAPRGDQLADDADCDLRRGEGVDRHSHRAVHAF